MRPWDDILTSDLFKVLPGEEAHLELSPLGRQKSSEALKGATSYRNSAVAVHILASNEPQILLTQRSSYQGAHSGQISFPGGKMEPSDPNPIFTARRESFEETGLPLESGLELGELTEVYIPVSKFLVKPFVFLHPTVDWNWKKDDREVDEIFFLPLEKLLDDNLRQSTHIDLGNGMLLKNIPCFNYENKIIWGATAIVLNEFKQLIKNAL
ncbi:MAG: CoA pyrophosphatase [Crocinitomicaceae bacterium]|nr:CoA pyrophosphatase [Crocinitomicaceae bacterium]